MANALKQGWDLLCGLHRWPKDCFALYQRVGQQWARMPQPWWSYRADPFLLQREGRVWLFFEEFEYLRNKGRLAACRLDGSGHTTILDLPYHLSYPFSLEYQGQWWLLPESCANQTVDLYECVDFPHRWRLRRRILQGVDAADSTLLFEEGRWWLFTSVRLVEDGPRHLEIYSTSDFLEGEWLAHPINARRLYADKVCGTGRCGGAFLRRGEGWIRPTQFSTDYYGQGLSFRRIQKLSLEHFEEQGVDCPEWPWRQNHHLSVLGDLQWINRKERMSYWERPRALDRAWLD